MSVGILVLPFLVLAVLGIGVLVYFLCYKAWINRKLQREESGAHVPMASTETVFKVVLIIGVLVLFWSLHTKINRLQDELYSVESNLIHGINILQSDLLQMKAEAKQAASLINDVTYTFGEIDAKEHTVEMQFRIVPKAYSADTKMSINIMGKSVSLTNNGDGSFTGSERFPMFEDFYEYGNSVFCIWENGVTTTEVWEAAPTGYLYMQCLSSFDVMTNNLGFEYEKGKIAVSGRVEVYASDWNTKRTAIRDMKLYVKKGNAVIDEIDMTNGYVELNRSYPMAEGERIAFYIKGVDESGYTHEMYVTGWTTEENPEDMWMEDGVSPYRVYAPDGTNMIE